MKDQISSIACMALFALILVLTFFYKPTPKPGPDLRELNRVKIERDSIRVLYDSLVAQYERNKAAYLIEIQNRNEQIIILRKKIQYYDKVLSGINSIPVPALMDSITDYYKAPDYSH
jgi:hypothetical protein